MRDGHPLEYSWWYATKDEPQWLRLTQIGIVITALIFVGMQLSGGLVRWVLDMVGGAVLTYIPNVMMLFCIVAFLSTEILYVRLRPLALFFLIWIFLTIVVGVFNTWNVAQSVFGLWVLLPFLFGLVAAPKLMSQHPWRPPLFGLFFTIAVGGILVHSAVALPWVGVSYSVGGVELEGAREWHASGGVQRLSGFARSSFDVAGQIIVATGLLSLHIKNAWVRMALWVLSAVAISLSTSKGILLTLLMTFVASEALRRDMKFVLYGIFVLGIFWLFLPPLMGWTMDWSQAARVDIDNPLYGSFIDRMNDMWPRAWELGTEHGLPLLGRGLGGIGVPLSIFEPNLANAGDNLWVYVMVIAGVVCMPFFVAGYTQIFKLCKAPFDIELQEVILFAVMVNWYGGVSNILEHAVLALVFGIVCRYLSTSFFNRNQVP